MRTLIAEEVGWFRVEGMSTGEHAHGRNPVDDTTERGRKCPEHH